MRVLEYVQSESDRDGGCLEVLDAFCQEGHRAEHPYHHPIRVLDQRPAVAPELIANCMDQWLDWIERTWPSTDHPHPDLVLNAYMIEFLKIHPFADGNGRVASLLYNHLNGSIYDPVPLPYYFGEEPS